MSVKPEPIILSQNAGAGGTPEADPPEAPGGDVAEDLLGLAVPELERALIALGEKPFRGRQVAEWLYARGARDFAGMTNLPAALRAKLAERYRVGSLRE